MRKLMSQEKWLLVAAICAASLSGMTTTALADADSQWEVIATEATTKGTLASGKRRSAKSEWTEFVAPKGYVIVPADTKVEYTSRAGSENSVDIVYEKYTEIIDGTDIKMPKVVRVRAQARSPKHKHGARGWTKAKVTVRIVRVR